MTTAEEVAEIKLTTEQLQQHVNSLYQLLNKVEDLLILSEAGSITITQAQNTALLSEYSNLKTLIQNTYSTLP